MDKNTAEQIRKEANTTLHFLGLLDVRGEAVDVMAAARQSLRNILTVCSATEPPEDGGVESGADQ